MSTPSELDALYRSIAGVLPRLSPSEQEMAYAVYQLLAGGRPVPLEAIGSTVGIGTHDVVRAFGGGGLRTLVLFDEARSIVGFGGITLSPTPHRFAVCGMELYTWCAWDALFLPVILDETATASTVCPTTGRAITVFVCSDGRITADPPTLATSFVPADAALCARSAQASIEAFCEHVHFFVSMDAARSWGSGRDEVRIVGLEVAASLARRFVIDRFPDMDAIRHRIDAGRSARRA